MVQASNDPLLDELKSVKMLLVLQLLMNGAKQSDIAMMLGVSDATVSRLIPKDVKASLKGRGDGR